MVLLHPEGVAFLNGTAAAIVELVNGRTTVASISAALRQRFEGVCDDDIDTLLTRLKEANWVDFPVADLNHLAPCGQRAPFPAGSPGDPVTRKETDPQVAAESPLGAGRPLGLLAELTHRCPLHCPYCSNPSVLTPAAAELPTATWRNVFAQARQLGVLQLHLSGGEPLLRRDLEILAAEARNLGLYVNLVTSAVGLSFARARALADAGVDHVQLSLQGAAAAAADRIAGARVHDRKLIAAAAVRAAGMALTINVVLHRGNIAGIDALVALAAKLGADRLELAHAQYYGWALRNRAALLPTHEQVQQAEHTVRAARIRFPQMPIIYVTADYYEKTPKPCMHGWGNRQLTVTPDGTVLPCPSAAVIPGLHPPDVRDAPLATIWAEAPVFTMFRGTDWLPAPCRDCPARAIDFGGCRCQAYQLLGNAAATDPVCRYSPHRPVVDAALAAAAAASTQPLVYRAMAPATDGREKARQPHGPGSAIASASGAATGPGPCGAAEGTSN
jgi:pyrroloquinoline quinone biosynthesis protein E